MRLGGRLQAAIEVLETIQTQHRPITTVLRDWGSAHRFAGSGDRAAIGNIVYDALRMKLSHAYLMDDDGPAALAVAVLLRQWNIAYDQLVADFEGDKFAPDLISQAAYEAYQARDLKQAAKHVQADIPEWLVTNFETVFGENWLEEAVAFNQRPTLDVRVNTLKATDEQVLKALSKLDAKACSLAPSGIRIDASEGAKRMPNLTADIPFAKGWFEIQDEGSQMAAEMVGAKPGEQVLDYCAGGGGKALALSAEMDNKGQIYTFDSDSRRMAPMIERIRRAGVRNIQICSSEEELEPHKMHCDRVLVDAPCTGTGTWRRRPETKWKLSEKNLEMRCSQQKEVLEKASSYVKEGGELTYVTCSVLPQENDAIIESFLASHSDFEIIDTQSEWKSITGMSTVPLSHTNVGILCSPHRTHTDGFFIAKLKHK
ncbi:RsmB/NOP family class I SAM-dependent RNA methyltransferase [Lentilitoribacter sp. Alg239-R112]|uniref:RsmB/NOP family class I SAM-dependent RNA methyltransferase n=1 Tax=Lentilitoribacter sp. Alg239-R112 TaxID=2305987 RepID=UPI0013A6F7B9|nr:RsmB/NOP family class I SAM-dependent RNA methyltransferase [Lentilitoribacter sp. Alg239-R112]